MLKEKQLPIWHACQTAYTIKHVHIECIYLPTKTEKNYNAGGMKELFKKNNERYNILPKSRGPIWKNLKN